jgi:hypothetical protein
MRLCARSQDDIRLTKIGLNSSADFTEQPTQRLAGLARCAAIDDVKAKNRFQSLMAFSIVVESVRIAFALDLELPI